MCSHRLGSRKLSARRAAGKQHMAAEMLECRPVNVTPRDGVCFLPRFENEAPKLLSSDAWRGREWLPMDQLALCLFI